MYKFQKRLTDILLSTIGLLVLSPLFIVIALIIRSKSDGSIIYSGVRTGLNFVSFNMYKFRTMAHDMENKRFVTAKNDSRVTRFGSILRKYKLDELPQLFNVIKGDMNLVGPRPLLTEYLSLYSDEQACRHGVRPGLTGWAQVNGCNAISWEKKFELDAWYADNQNFWLDLKIIWLTLRKVVTRDEISANREATMSKFRG